MGLIGLVHRAPNVRLAFETQRRSRRGLLFGQAIDPVVHDDVSHLDVLARGMVDMIPANGKRVAVAAKDEDVQIGPRQRDAAGKGQGAAMNEMGAVGLDKIGEPAGTTDAGHGGDLFLPQFALLNQFEIEGQNGKVAATRAPGGMVGRDFLFGQRLAFGFRQARRRRQDGRCA